MNLDGSADCDDLTIIVENNGQAGGWSAGDMNCDGLVDVADRQVYLDNACVADLAAPFGGVLNVFDFLQFQTFFSESNPCADISAPFGVFNVFDFLAFQTAFGNGC